MDARQAKKLIEEILSGHCVRLSDHCRARMIERGIGYDDLLSVMATGRVIETRQNPNTGDYVATIEGRAADGESLTMQAVILEAERRVLCVTVY